MTMIGSEFHPDQFQSHKMVIEVNGEQYAKLPEGWPAAEDKDLEEAYAEAVTKEGDNISRWGEAVASSGPVDPESHETRVRDIYASFTPEEVQELCEDWSRLVQENRALRKGMKTMQKKARKHTQAERRLQRRLAQARAGREQLRATASKLAQRKIEDAAEALLEVLDKRGVVVRGGE